MSTIEFITLIHKCFTFSRLISYQEKDKTGKQCQEIVYFWGLTQQLYCPLLKGKDAHWQLCITQGTEGYHSKNNQYFNSLGPSDAIWPHRSGSTLAQVMACCLTAPSHYLNQYWFIISEALWHSSKINFTSNAQTTILYNEFENDNFEIITTSPRGHWVNSSGPWRCGSNLNLLYPKTCYGPYPWAVLMKLVLGECHRTPLVIGQHWFR